MKDSTIEMMKVIEWWEYTLDIKTHTDGSVEIDFRRNPRNGTFIHHYHSIDVGIKATYVRVNWIIWNTLEYWIRKLDIKVCPR